MKAHQYFLLTVFICFSFIYANAQSQSAAAACCSKPSGLKVTSTTDSSACLKWRIRDSARCDTPKGYQVQIKTVSGGVWRTQKGNYTGSSAYFTSCTPLKSCTNYQWRVRNICIKNGDTTASPYVNGPNFKTKCSGTGRFVAPGDQAIKIYPNPASDKIIINASYDDATSVQVIIAGRSGNRVMEKTVSVVNGSLALPVDVSRFTSGVYFVTVSDGRTALKTTFVKN